MITHRAEILAEIERRRLDLNLALIKVFNYYRVLVGLSLLAVITQTFIETRLGTLLPSGFISVTIIYTAINLSSAVVLQLVPRRLFSQQYISFALVMYDVLALQSDVRHRLDLLVPAIDASDQRSVPANQVELT